MPIRGPGTPQVPVPGVPVAHAVAERGGRFRLEAEYLPAYNSASCLSGLKPLLHLEISGHGSSATGWVDLAVRQVDSGYDELLRLTLPRESRSVPRQPPPLARLDALERISQRIPGWLDIVADEEPLDRWPISLLPTWSWPLGREMRGVAGSYVLPGSEAVGRLVVGAELRAREQGDTEPWTRQVESGRPEVGPKILAALYAFLAETHAVEYEPPRAEEDAWAGGHHQRIRPPDAILPAGVSPGGKSRALPGRATCLDLSLLLAGCLESIGLAPLLLFTGTVDAAPEHAFLGLWSDSARRFRPLLTDAGVLGESVASGRLQVVETTGICTGPHRLGFAAAQASARARLEGPAGAHAVDIRAGRPPQGLIASIEMPHDPVVRRALWSALEFGERRRAAYRETIDILYGLCVAEGEIFPELLRRCGSSTGRMVELLERTVPAGSAAGPPQSTRNYEICLSCARLNARRSGADLIREGDLAWAVLESASRNIRPALESGGCNFATLLRELDGLWARPSIDTESRHHVSRAGGEDGHVG